MFNNQVDNGPVRFNLDYLLNEDVPHVGTPSAEDQAEYSAWLDNEAESWDDDDDRFDDECVCPECGSEANENAYCDFC